MSKWKLYWVASNGIEDCFVVAKNSRSAKRLEKETNGFNEDDITVTRIIDVPDKYEKEANKRFREWSIKNNCNMHLDINELPAWPYYAEDWLLEELGAEIRYINETKQILIDDTVYSKGYVYNIGKKAMKELYELTNEDELDISNVNDEGIEEVIDIMLGKALILIHEIENYIAKSYIFIIGNRKYKNYTINDAIRYLKDRLTLGNLINLMEEKYIIKEEIRNSLQLFLTQRNKIAHGLTKDERFDISTSWGQKEIVGYLALFLENGIVLKKVIESAYITTMAFSVHLLEKEENISKELENFKNDPCIQEKISLFNDVFKLKENK